MSGQIIRSKTKIYPLLTGDGVNIKVDILTVANIFESNSKLNLSNPDSIHYVEECYAKDIKSFIQQSLEKVQKQLNVDVYGFGSVVNGKYPKQWENHYKESWNKDFSCLNVNISCRVKIYGTGFDTKSLTKKEEEILK